MTTWRPESGSRVNAAAGRAAVPVSPEVFSVVQESINYSRRSAARSTSRFMPSKDCGTSTTTCGRSCQIPRRSSAAYRSSAGSRSGSTQDHTIMLGKPGMAINLGGIGKGYAVDAAVRVLRDLGLRNGMVQAGGDLMLFGSKAGQPFVAGIRDPRGNAGDYFAVCRCAITPSPPPATMSAASSKTAPATTTSSIRAPATGAGGPLGHRVRQGMQRRRTDSMMRSLSWGPSAACSSSTRSRTPGRSSSMPRTRFTSPSGCKGWCASCIRRPRVFSADLSSEGDGNPHRWVESF